MSLRGKAGKTCTNKGAESGKYSQGEDDDDSNCGKCESVIQDDNPALNCDICQV